MTPWGPLVAQEERLPRGGISEIHLGVSIKRFEALLFFASAPSHAPARGNVKDNRTASNLV